MNFVLFSLIGVVSFLGLFTNDAWPGSGAGARGGGTGIICQDGQSPVSLEEFFIHSKLKSVEIPTSRRMAAQWFTRNLKSSPELLRRFINTWENLGAFDTWEFVEDDQARDKILDRDSFEHRTGASIIRALKTLDIDFDSQGGALPLIHDDFIKIPEDCRKIQLSALVDNHAIRFVKPNDLSEGTKRYLEAHEAFYLIGMNFYDHQLPIRTRDLITKITTSYANPGSASLRELKKSIHRFVYIPKKRTEFDRFNRILIQWSMDYPAHIGNWDSRCPLAMSFLSDGDTRYVTSLEVRNHQALTIFRQAEKLLRPWIKVIVGNLSPEY